MRCAASLFIVILLLISPAAVPAATVTFATNAVISETNLAYDGQDIVISGAGVIVAMDGSHAFNSLLLTNGAGGNAFWASGSRTGGGGGVGTFQWVAGRYVFPNHLKTIASTLANWAGLSTPSRRMARAVG